MKRILLTFLISFSFYFLQAQTTYVYVVRHAEKDLKEPKDPGLTPEGLQRAHELDKILEPENIQATFSTNFKRTLLTVQPIAQRIKKNTIVYNGIDSLVNKVMTDYKGKAVLIAGHSNTVLTIVKAFGGTPAINEIKDYEYGHLFKLEIGESKVATSLLQVGQ